ncbi:MAG: hypothetical protein EOO12_12645 [Chitinophagaceae bacterium]|nr:MAG: hypothetical protein EOO12_12645 [Chitinophagaceae bacterium]
MTPEENRFRAIGGALPGAESGQLFGKPCFKKGGKAFTCFFQNEMVFKLTGPAHAGALAVPGAKLFDPSGKGRPMKEWVQVPPAGDWEGLARAAAGIE